MCLEDNDVDITILAKVMEELKRKAFEVIVPPPLRVKKSVSLRRLDHEIMSYAIEDTKRDIEDRNIWAKAEEVVKLRNIAHMLKIHFRDIAMARKAITSGLCMFAYHLNPSQIEQEEFYSITPYWACYKYNHQVSDCPEKGITVCSERAKISHSLRGSQNKDHPKCLNCEGAHCTLAASCPVPKDIIKRKRNESN